MFGEHQRFVADEEGGGIDVDDKAIGARFFQGARHIRRFEKAVMDLHREEALAELLDFDAPARRHDGRVLDIDMHQHDALVQNLVVLEIVQKGAGHRIVAGGKEDSCARDPGGRFLGALHKEIERHGFVADALDMSPAPQPPGLHHDEHAGGDGERQPAALDDLQAVGEKECDVDECQHAEDDGGQAHAPFPLPGRDDGGVERVDQHDARHRDAISRRERARRVEDQNDQHHAEKHRDVHHRHEDLAVIGGRGVADFHARQLTELDGLARHGEHAGDHGLRGDDGGKRGQQHEGIMRPLGRKRIKHGVRRTRIVENQCALAEIVQQQRRQHDDHPGLPDRLFAEMAHIGIQRLATCHRQHDRTERDKRGPRFVREESGGIKRIDRHQNARRMHDRKQTERGNGYEPHHHDGPE